MADVKDQMARDDANRALLLIEGHERVCTERQGHIIQNLDALRRGVEGLYRRFWAAAICCISLLVTACASLLWLIVRMPH